MGRRSRSTGGIPLQVSVRTIDLGAKTASVGTLNPGDSFYHAIAATNYGPTYPSTGFTVTDDLDKWLGYVSSTPAGVCTAAVDPGSPDPAYGQIVICHVMQDLPLNAAYNIVLHVQVHPIVPGDPDYGTWTPSISNQACVVGNEAEPSPDTHANCATASNPTLVHLKRFVAWPQPPAIHAQWETSQEVDNDAPARNRRPHGDGCLSDGPLRLPDRANVPDRSGHLADAGRLLV